MSTVDPQARSFQEGPATYMLPVSPSLIYLHFPSLSQSSHQNDAQEWNRLDEMHKGIDAFLGHKLSYAPLSEDAKRILEIGWAPHNFLISLAHSLTYRSGSGAWAIQAAETYPDATVTAVDLSPLPPRPLPKNVTFLKLNIVEEELPFEPASFDIIHTRFLLTHLPKWEDVVQRVTALLKPGGWLLVEDIDHIALDDNGGAGPGVQKFYNIYHAFAATQNVDHMVGSKLEGTLKRLNLFSIVNGIEVKCPFHGGSNDPSLHALGRTMRKSLITVYKDLNPRLVAAGLTPEVQQGFFQEAGDRARGLYVKLYMTWSRKK
ncbi:hypothetical protein D9615_004191 [Tricholomella constricta]|uniref:S-adenosyl-L-methionine-dependent methyltransferase n=1 Tax=Tricholomella constricta TaxID=117010 RepID=A0A8H5HF04_9AGAR|nr:hypothetical protein D9615_004191 [Tricholomella constricta]